MAILIFPFVKCQFVFLAHLSIWLLAFSLLIIELYQWIDLLSTSSWRTIHIEDIFSSSDRLASLLRMG